MREHIRSNVIGYVALFCFAMAGTAGALPGRNTVNSQDIVDGEVKRPDIAAGAVNSAKVPTDALTGDDIDELTLQGLPVTGPAGGDLTGNFPEPQIAAGAVAGPEVALDSLNSVDIAASGIGSSELASSSVGSSEVASNALGGADIDELDLSVDAMGCKPGLVLGFARIKGDPDMPATPSSSSTWIDHDRTCRALSGYQVTVERNGTGDYTADFWPPGFPIAISGALATADATDDLACEDNIASVRVLSEGRVVVNSFDNDGDRQDCWVSLVIL